MSAQAHPRPRVAAGGAGPFTCNLLLLPGCVLPLGATARAAELWLESAAPDPREALKELLLAYELYVIPVTVLGILYLVLVMPLAAMHPAWGREIAFAPMMVCFMGLMALVEPPHTGTILTWTVLGASMAGWVLAIRLTGRATTAQYLVAVTPVTLLVVAASCWG